MAEKAVLSKKCVCVCVPQIEQKHNTCWKWGGRY